MSSVGPRASPPPPHHHHATLYSLVGLRCSTLEDDTTTTCPHLIVTIFKEQASSFKCRQVSSSVIKNHQASPIIIKCLQVISRVIKSHQASSSSSATKHHQASSSIIKHNQASSNVTKHHQVTSGAQH